MVQVQWLKALAVLLGQSPLSEEYTKCFMAFHTLSFPESTAVFRFPSRIDAVFWLLRALYAQGTKYAYMHNTILYRQNTFVRKHTYITLSYINVHTSLMYIVLVLIFTSCFFLDGDTVILFFFLSLLI